MGVRCVYFGGSDLSCQVIRNAGPALAPEIQARLRQRYCQSGAFITCPVYCRVEQTLDQAHLLSRTAHTDHHRDSEPGI